MNSPLREQLEAKIVVTIQNGLQQQQITGDRAKEIAQKVLALIPENISDQQLLQIIPKLDDQMVELTAVVHQILLEQDEKLKAEAIPRIKAMLSQLK